MKTAVSVLALAAGAAATGFRNFAPFPCPANTDNKCTDFQKPGFSFGDLNLGPFTQYKDFSWKGFTCGGGRSSNSGGKSIGGVCTSDKGSSPSFGCGPAVDKFSLGSIFVKPEFDCDLEFHYDMPDGKICKHRNSCKKSGTNVVNSQCGGAKNVTIIFPKQPNKPKPSCSVDISTISFDCNPPKTTTTRTTIASTQSTVSTTSTIPTAPTLPPFSTPTTPTAPTTPVVTPPTTVPTTSVPVNTDTTTVPVNTDTTTAPVDTDTKTVPTIGDSTSFTVPRNTQPTTEITTTVVTSFQTTSTIFSTVVSTILSCAPTVPNCPGNGNGVTTTVVTVAISTTVCPVTETRTTVLTTTNSVPVNPPVSTPGNPPVNPPVSPPVNPPNSGSSTTLTVDISTLTTSVRPITTTTGNSPVETLPCPAVVPACLNTFLFTVGCADNSEANCYCPDTIFVKNVFECIYAHGETDTIISEAVLFFQGICAPHLPSNPGIATGADITKFITVTATPTAIAPIFTTVTVDATTVVPCTDEAGEIIPNSSTTVIVSTTLAVPQVGFTTASGTVGVIPVTQAPIPIPNPGAPGAPGAPGSAPAITSFASAPVGTGGFRPTTTGFPVVTAGVGRVTAGMGFSLGMALLAVLGL